MLHNKRKQSHARQSLCKYRSFQGLHNDAVPGSPAASCSCPRRHAEAQTILIHRISMTLDPQMCKYFLVRFPLRKLQAPRLTSHPCEASSDLLNGTYVRCPSSLMTGNFNSQTVSSKRFSRKKCALVNRCPADSKVTLIYDMHWPIVPDENICQTGEAGVCAKQASEKKIYALSPSLAVY